PSEDSSTLSEEKSSVDGSGSSNITVSLGEPQPKHRTPDNKSTAGILQYFLFNGTSSSDALSACTNILPNATFNYKHFFLKNGSSNHLGHRYFLKIIIPAMAIAAPQNFLHSKPAFSTPKRPKTSIP